MKRLLFRSTRGKAILNTFDLTIEEEDVLLDEDDANRIRGYFVLFEDGDVIRRIITRVCKSFMGAVYETSLTSVQ